MQWSFPFLVLRFCIASVLQESSEDHEVATRGCNVYSRPPVCHAQVGICSTLNQHFGAFLPLGLINPGRYMQGCLPLLASLEVNIGPVTQERLYHSSLAMLYSNVERAEAISRGSVHVFSFPDQCVDNIDMTLLGCCMDTPSSKFIGHQKRNLLQLCRNNPLCIITITVLYPSLKQDHCSFWVSIDSSNVHQSTSISCSIIDRCFELISQKFYNSSKRKIRLDNFVVYCMVKNPTHLLYPLSAARCMGTLSS